MRSAPVAAAAPGLPEQTTDFHLSIGRHIASIRADIERTEAMTLDRSCPAGKRRLDHLCDRDDTLIRALAALPAETLAGAAVQVAAAIKLLSLMELFDDRRHDDERAVRRLLDSAVTVMIDAAGIDPIRDGVDELAEREHSAWGTG